MVLELKFGQIIHSTKPTYYITATPILQWSWSQSLVKLYTRQNLHTTTQLLPYFSGFRAKTHPPALSSEELKKAHLKIVQQLQRKTRPDELICVKLYTRQTCILQHSYSHTSVELEPKFGQIIHKTKPAYYNTATPIFQWC